MISLYQDQEEFVAEIRNLWKSHKRIVGLAPTGAGKTRIAARIIEGYVSRGLRVCFLVPRISLIAQTANEFSELGLTDITYIWGNYDTDHRALITIASADTYIRREKGNFDLVIVDEMHHRKIKLLEWMESHPEDRYLGLSATPFANWIGTYYTGLAKGKSVRWLIDNGRLADYEIYAPFTPDLTGVKTKPTGYGDDYAESDLADVMGDAQVVGDVVKNWLEHGENRLTMVLPVNVAHANHLAIEFNRSGVSCEVISASVPVEERERIFARVRAGITRIIASVNCLTEGFNIPEISCVINARPTKSRARYVQGVGRGMRKKPDGYKFQNCLIFDHSGTSISLGFPEDITIDSLSSGSDGLDRNKANKKDEAEEKKPKECPQCHFLKLAGKYICPKCGFKPALGEDVEVDDTRGLTKLGEKKKYTKEDKQLFFSQLLGYKIERANDGKTISDGWIAHTYKEKFGAWPNGLQKYPRPVGVEVRNFIKAKNIRFAKRANG